VLSIGKLGAGGARYYTEGLGAVDEYYSEAGSRTGVWMGQGASLLGLSGDVDASVLGHVLDGRDPAGGDRLCGSRSVVPGFDLCFRAPKSVSLLQALGRPEVSAEVLAAHRNAVTEALGWLEREAVMVRRGHGGLTVVATAGVVGAGFEHFTSRSVLK
jgi:conjugative relaxase-like TrwC/TraI family protein